MTLQQLQYFLVMSQVLHYTKAASQLYVSQPALSYSLSELAKELGVPLFEKKNNHVILTLYGETFLPYVREILQTLDKATEHIYSMVDSNCGQIELGYIHSVSFDFVPQLMEKFYRSGDYGNVTFGLYQGMHISLIDKLLDGTIDLAFSAQPCSTRIVSTPVFSQELYAVVPYNHPLANHKVVSLEELVNEPLISVGSGSQIRTHLNACFANIGAEPHFVTEVAECTAIAAYVSAGKGVAITPLTPPVENSHVVILRFKENEREKMSRTIYLLRAKERCMLPVAQKFYEFVTQEQSQSI